MKIEDLTNEEKIEILEAMKKMIENHEAPGLCSALSSAKARTNSMRISRGASLSILGFKQPKQMFGAFWWRPYEPEPRIKAIDEAIHRIKFEITTRALNEKEAEKGSIIYRN